MKTTKKERNLIEKKRLSYSTLKERQTGGRQWKKARQTLNTNEARRLAVERAHSGEFWTILFSQQSAPFFLQLVAKHYSNPLTDDDAAACLVTCKSLAAQGVEFLVASFRRRRMLAPVLKQEFAEQFDTEYTTAQMVNSLLILAVEPELAEAAAHAGEHLFYETK